jgi:hypothetical protein
VVIGFLYKNNSSWFVKSSSNNNNEHLQNIALVGVSHINLAPSEIVAQVLKCAGKRTWRPERVVPVAGSCGGVPCGAMAGVALAAGLQCSRSRFL